jgi:hypothetical protein
MKFNLKGALTGVLLVTLMGCGGSAGYVDEPEAPKNTDPRHGTVQLGDENIYKRCDGTTLVYFGNNQQIVVNSPECTG